MKLNLRSILFSVFVLLMFSLQNNSFGQSAQLVFGTTSAVYVNISGGIPATPIYLVIDNTSTSAILNASSSNRWIISEGDYNFLKWDMAATNGSYIYPFGYSTTDYLPFTYNKLSGNANAAISTRGTANANTPLANGVTNMNPSGAASDAANMAVDRWWRIKQENGTTAPTADLTFSYRGTENSIVGISCPTDFLKAQYWNGTNWIVPALTPGSACATVGVATASATNVAVFTTSSNHPFVLTKNGAPLPVTWLDASAECDHGNMTIKWSTASEQNSDYYTVEKSLDGTDYTSVATVKAAGNSSTTKNYSIVDHDAYSGTSFYRVKETDFDGSFTYSGVMTVSGCNSDNIIIYGTDGGASININAMEDGAYTIEMYDMLGQKLITETKNVGAGNNHIKLSAGNVASAVYVVKVYNSSNAVAKKVFIRSAIN